MISASVDKLRVAVVGAGPSGLTAMKALVEEGFDPVCFESGDGIGGIFKYTKTQSRPAVWESCSLVSSIYVTNFSDFFPDENTRQPYEHRQFHHGEYLAYLEAYAVAHHLLGRIRFGCDVLSLRRVREGRHCWQVSVSTPSGRETHEFDAVAICSGLHRTSHVPGIDGLESFCGQVLHSAEYRSPSSVTGSRVLVIGAGESGADIASEVAHDREAVFISLRRGAFVLPRLIRGVPSDYFGTRLFYSLPAFIARRSDAGSTRYRSVYGKIALPLRLLPLALHRCAVRLAEWRHRRTGPSPGVAARIMAMRKTVGGTQFETFATKTDAFLRAVDQGRCELKPSVESIRGDIAYFSDGTSSRVNSIVMCTGFRPATVPFLAEPVDLSALYLQIFSPDFGESLAFIGFVRPSLGAIPPLSEMQARLWVQALIGSVRLPDAGTMNDRVSADRNAHSDVFREVHERLPQLVDFSTYLEDLAEIVGCKPTIGRLRGDLGIIPRLYCTPYSPVQYRLVGPHARPVESRALIRHAPWTGDLLKITDLLISKVLASVGADAFKASLTLLDRNANSTPGKRHADEPADGSPVHGISHAERSRSATRRGVNTGRSAGKR